MRANRVPLLRGNLKASLSLRRRRIYMYIYIRVISGYRKRKWKLVYYIGII